MRKIYVLASLAMILSTGLGMEVNSISDRAGYSSDDICLVKGLLSEKKEVAQKRDKEFRSGYSAIKKAIESQDWKYRKGVFSPLLKLLNKEKKKNFTYFLNLPKFKKIKNLKQGGSYKENLNRLSGIIQFSNLVDSRKVIRLVLCGKNKTPLKKNIIEELYVQIFKEVRDLIESCQERFPLHYACEKGYENLVKYFVEHRMVDVNQVDDDGKKALFYAHSSGNENLVNYLIRQQKEAIEKNENSEKLKIVTQSSALKEFPEEDGWVTASKILSRYPLYKLRRGY